MSIPILYLVVPCYNEEDVLQAAFHALREKYRKLMDEGKISADSKILFVNDGSKDHTWAMIHDAFSKDAVFCGISLSRNQGHQNAVLAGLMMAKEKADAVISIDADLQQDINAIDLMLDKYTAGYDIVYGVRNTRDTDGPFKKVTALGFYHFMKIMGCEVLKNHADYRLLSKRALDSLSEYEEVNLFLRGMIPMIGYPSDIVYFDVRERQAGKSKYTPKKMFSFAVNGITSLSIKPIHYILFIGIIFMLISVILTIITIIEYYTGKTVAGWASSYISTWFLGSVQLISISVIGEYIGKVYLETKKRPRYHIESCLWREDQANEDKPV